MIHLEPEWSKFVSLDWMLQRRKVIACHSLVVPFRRNANIFEYLMFFDVTIAGIKKKKLVYHTETGTQLLHLQLLVDPEDISDSFSELKTKRSTLLIWGDYSVELQLLDKSMSGNGRYLARQWLIFAIFTEFAFWFVWHKTARSASGGSWKETNRSFCWCVLYSLPTDLFVP